MKIGDKIKGFKFKGNRHFGYNLAMNDFIGRVGVITDIETDSVIISFYKNDDLIRNNLEEYWYYPIKEAYNHLVDESSNDMFPIY